MEFFRWINDVLEKLADFNVYFKLSKGRFGLGVLFILTCFVFKIHIPPKHDIKKKVDKGRFGVERLIIERILTG